MGKAIKSTARTTTEKPKSGKCVECAHAYVMSDHQPRNPLISICGKNHERYSQGHTCQICGFAQRVGELVIHEMIYLNQK